MNGVRKSRTYSTRIPPSIRQKMTIIPSSNRVNLLHKTLKIAGMAFITLLLKSKNNKREQYSPPQDYREMIGISKKQQEQREERRKQFEEKREQKRLEDERNRIDIMVELTKDKKMFFEDTTNGNDSFDNTTDENKSIGQDEDPEYQEYMRRFGKVRVKTKEPKNNAAGSEKQDYRVLRSELILIRAAKEFAKTQEARRIVAQHKALHG